MDTFQNKYRIQSARLQNWDYGSNAMYFITICTNGREHFFGKISDGEMELSEIGQIAHQYWQDITIHFPFAILDESVIMPNHVHGIVIIEKNNNTNSITIYDATYDGVDNAIVETPKLGVSTTNAATNPTTIDKRQQTFNASQKWKPASLGVVINQYKRAVTIDARKINSGFAWQPRFYDHIIRNDKEYQRIKNYIINNPANWNDDTFSKNQ